MQDDTTISLDHLLAHRDWIRGLAGSLVRDPSTVDDIEQDVYVAAMSSRPVNRSIRGWLGRVVRNSVYQRHRRDTRRTDRERSVARDDAVRSTEEIVAEADAHRHVVQAVMQLDEPYRTAIVLRYFEGLTVKGTANRLGVPMQTAKTRLRRARAVLRERLRREHGDECGVPAVLLLLTGASDLGAPGRGKAASTHSDSPALPAPRPGALRRFLPIAVSAGAVGVAALLASDVFGGGDGPGSRGERVVAGVGDSDAPVGGKKADAAQVRRERGRRGRVRAQQAPPNEVADGAAGTDLRTAAAPTEFVVRDLMTRDPVPSLTLALTSGGVERTIVSDADGRVPVPPAGVERVITDDETWTIPGSPRPLAVHEGSLWVHRTIAVDVRVTTTGDDGTVAVVGAQVWSFVGTDLASSGRSGPGSYSFAVRTGLGGMPGSAVTGDGGRLRLDAPLVPRLHVAAGGSGVRRAWAEVPIAPGGTVTSRPIELVLRRSVTVSGRVTDHRGESVTGTEVRIEVYRTGKGPSPDIGRLAAEGGGGGGFRGGADWWAASWAQRAAVNARGVFQDEINVDGGVMLIVTAPGYVQQRKELGHVREDRHKIEVRLRRPDVSVTTLLQLDGVPRRNARMMFHDVTGTPQVSTFVTTDDEGRFPRDLLIEGHRYHVRPADSRRLTTKQRFMTWDRRPTIELSELSDKFDAADEAADNDNDK